MAEGMRLVTTILLVMLTAISKAGVAGPVSESEAVEVADKWLSDEVKLGYAALDDAGRLEALAAFRDRQVFSLLEGESLVQGRPTKGEVLAYIVKYARGGWVVVSSDDRLEPVIAFDIRSEFRWDQPERNFTRHFLSRTMAARHARLKSLEGEAKAPGVHPRWTFLRSRSREVASGAVLIRWSTARWGQGQYYNDTAVANNGGIDVKAGCTAVAMAIQFRFHKWPPTGRFSHSYSDTQGAVQFSHSVNFGNQAYNWGSMPTENLTGPDADVADLIYHCGVAVDMNYEVGASGAWPSASATDDYFQYKGTTQRFVLHESALTASVRGGLPTIYATMRHSVVVCGYRDTESPYYYLNMGWGGANNGWLDLRSVPGSTPGQDWSYPYSSPISYTYVDGGAVGFENGCIQWPYNTLSEGQAGVEANGRLWVKAGTYTGEGNHPVTFNWPMTITAYEGTVKIADNLLLAHKEGDGISFLDLPAIRITGGGSIKLY